MENSIGKKLLLCVLLILSFVLCTACGDEERTLGIDGYTYVAKQLGSASEADYARSWLWTKEGIYCAASSSRGTMYSLALEQDSNILKQQPVFGTEHSEGILAFAVNPDGDIYWVPIFHFGVEGIYRYDARKKQNETIPVPLGGESVNGMAADGSGRIYLLLSDELWILDREGQVQSKQAADEYRFEATAYVSENLLNDESGNLFYIQDTTLGGRIKMLLNGEQEWTELTGLPDFSRVNGVWPTGEGKLLINGDGLLYEYMINSSSAKAVLKFAECDLLSGSVNAVFETNEEDYLLAYTNNNYQTEFYRLTKTSVEELPEKELIIMVSFDPSSELQAAVVEFNKMSDRYRVMIENYNMQKTDASLSSANCPDLLDTGTRSMGYGLGWPLEKYADKDVLEDLTPYLEQSEIIHKEDFLESIVEGYTVKGRLVCIPTYFYINPLIGRTSQVGEKRGWTFEDVKTLLETYPNSPVFTKKEMLYAIFYQDYTNRFVDYETGECSFDSEEFYELVHLIEENSSDEHIVHSYNESAPKDCLFEEIFFTDFSDLASQRLRYGENITLKGYVSADGEPVYNYTVLDQVGIVSRSKHKEGAWAFLEYFLSKSIDIHSGFSTKKADLQRKIDKTLEVDEFYDNDGSLLRISANYRMMLLNGEWIWMSPIPQEDVDMVMEIINTMDFAKARVMKNAFSTGGIHEIVFEELEPYFAGTKELADAAQIINSRVRILVNESR